MSSDCVKLYLSVRYACDSGTLDCHLKDLFRVLNSSTATTYELTKVLGISRGKIKTLYKHKSMGKIAKSLRVMFQKCE